MQLRFLQRRRQELAEIDRPLDDTTSLFSTTILHCPGGEEGELGVPRNADASVSTRFLAGGTRPIPSRGTKVFIASTRGNANRIEAASRRFMRSG